MIQRQINWTDKVAVVTGGASGIGRQIVQKCLSLKMKVVLADINEKDMVQVKNELKVDESRLITVRTDVTKFEALENLAVEAYRTYGKVDILFNNAGVANNAFVWEASLKDWNWIMGVNLMGVVHGIKAFTSRMIAQDSDCFIINTSSLSGLMSANLGIYSVSKHAVVSLSETLQQSLKLVKAKIQVGVLCPGFIKTNINESERNRPDTLSDSENEKQNEIHPELQKMKGFIDKVVANGMDPKDAVEILFKEIEEGKFYILTHKDERTIQSIKIRNEGVLEGILKI